MRWLITFLLIIHMNIVFMPPVQAYYNKDVNVQELKIEQIQLQKEETNIAQKEEKLDKSVHSLNNVVNIFGVILVLALVTFMLAFIFTNV